ncbi:hypothetical protein [Polaribacter vadi]|uniref:hypothetical protein n=1 Tax=Polaribacter vadi TaxID=1774273 RepID=UPI0030EB18C2
MHKKLEADLISLAHSILQMKNKDNVFLLKQKSKEIYEKLSVLAFVEEYVNSTPGLKKTKTELLETVEKAFAVKEEENVEKLDSEKVVYNLDDALKIVENEVVEHDINAENNLEIDHQTEIENEIQNQPEHKEVIEQPFDELEEIMFSKEIPPKSVENEEPLEEVPEIKSKEITETKLKKALETEKEMLNEVQDKELQHKKETQANLENESDVVKVEVRKTMSLEEELQDIVSVDFMADLFEKAPAKSLNDRLVGNIQIGLNDRIAFVKNLFNGNQEDYNRVISQLNTLKSGDEAKNFINSMVKPDYNWSEKEELETRFMEIIERKFA